MIRTQIYLTEEEKAGLSQLSTATGKPQSELIREAVDGLIARSSKSHREAVLKRVAGMWREREDLPDFAAVRKQWDREHRT